MDDFVKLQKDIDVRWDKLRAENQAAHEKFMKEFADKMDRQDKSLEKGRALSREAIYRIIFIATGTIAFSVTLASTTALKLNVDQHTLKLSWAVLLMAVCIGLFINLFESRLDYAIAWRAIQHQDWDNRPSWAKKIWIWLVTLYVFFIKPRSLAFCKIYKTDDEKAKMAIAASQVITNLNILKHLFFIIELSFYISFITGLILLVKSFL